MKTLWIIAALALLPADANAQMMSVEVHGMSCAPCASMVKASLEQLPQVKEATVELEAHKASLALKDINDAPSDAALKTAIEKAGYTAGAVTR